MSIRVTCRRQWNAVLTSCLNDAHRLRLSSRPRKRDRKARSDQTKRALIGRYVLFNAQSTESHIRAIACVEGKQRMTIIQDKNKNDTRLLLLLPLVIIVIIMDTFGIGLFVIKTNELTALYT